MNKVRALIAVLLCACMLFGCSTKEPVPSAGGSDPSAKETVSPTLPTEMTYRVQVLNADGTPVSGGVIVTFLSDGESVGMQMVNTSGFAEKVLPTGSYTVELGFTDNSVTHHYVAENLILTPDSTQLEVILSQGLSEQSISISAYSDAAGSHKSYTASFAHSGYTYVPLDTSDRTYILFQPQQSGLYRFSIVDQSAHIGYYGSQHFVQQMSIADIGEDGSFTVNISNGMIGTGDTGTTILVLGLDAISSDECIVVIERIGDPEMTIEDLPWDVYQTTASLSTFTLPETVILRDFDVTAASDAYPLVKGADGRYHVGSEDGYVVYVRLGSPSTYLDSIETILETSGISKYYTDDSGNVIRKESYTQCLLQYIEYMDEISGVYPLTDDLIYIIQSRGAYAGWWDSGSPNYIFEDVNGNPIPGINPDIAWMFLLCYGEADPDDPCGNGHTEEVDPAKAASCTENGLTEGKHCSVCGTITVAQQIISATGHDYGAWNQIVEPSAESEGLAERTCRTCGHTEQKSLDKLGDSGSGTEPEPEKIVGTPANPDEALEIGGSLAISFDADVSAGQYVIYKLYKVSGTWLTIHDEYAYVVYEGKTYWPENGTVKVFISSEGPTIPMEVWIGNFGFDNRTIHVDCLYPLGSSMNPAALPLGAFSTKLSAGEEQGYYYSFVADTNGTLTIHLDSLSVDALCSVTLYNLDSYAYVTMEGDSVCVEVMKGETVQIIIGIYTEDFKYPGGTVLCTATFE